MRKLVPTTVVILAFAFVFAGASFAADSGADLFKSKCAMCHGPDGKGETAMGKKFGLKDLGSADVQGKSDADLNGIITNGKDKMPAYKGKLTSEQIDEVVKFIRTLKK
ncbi:MAG TPA: cytochrome c [Terriglobales bacterium]|nr:cytochrome c [Terriglobales bacterium]